MKLIMWFLTTQYNKGIEDHKAKLLQLEETYRTRTEMAAGSADEVRFNLLPSFLNKSSFKLNCFRFEAKGPLSQR